MNSLQAAVSLFGVPIRIPSMVLSQAGRECCTPAPTYHTRQTTHLAMFLRVRRPFRPPDEGSSGLGSTRSIFDMTLIHGISRLTIADIADITPLYQISTHVSTTTGGTDLKNLYLSSMNCDSSRYVAHVRMPNRLKFVTREGKNVWCV